MAALSRFLPQPDLFCRGVNFLQVRHVNGTRPVISEPRASVPREILPLVLCAHEVESSAE